MNQPLIHPLEPDADTTAFVPDPVGPSSQGCCKVTNGNACGSGSLVGKRNGKSIVLTNAHVAGTRVGHTVICLFPFANNLQVRGRVIMAGYSDRVMMDWCVLELEREIDLPHTKLSIEAPTGKHYSAGYPRCRGPYFSEIATTSITHNGTVWRWQPNAIGGQSGSGVHSVDTNLQRGLLTWSWGGDGAGQTTRSIWFQYANRAAIGFPRPEGLVELADEIHRAEHLEEGFFAEANITTLPIWDHLDDDDDEPPTPPTGDCPGLSRKILRQLAVLSGKIAVMETDFDSGMEEIEGEMETLTKLAENYKPAEPVDPADPNDPEDPGTDDGSGPLFGL